MKIVCRHPPTTQLTRMDQADQLMGPDGQHREEGEYVELDNVRHLRDQLQSLVNENRELRRILARQHELLGKLSNLVSGKGSIIRDRGRVEEIFSVRVGGWVRLMVLKST